MKFSCGVNIEIRSSALFPAGSCDFGAKKTFVSYCSTTEIEGTTRICCAEHSGARQPRIRSSAKNHRLTPQTFKYCLWHNNDITSLKEEIALRILTLKNVFIGNWNLNLLRLSLTIRDYP